MNKDLEGYLDQAKQWFDVNKSEHPDSTLTTTLRKPTGEANQYVQFGYLPQTICDTLEDKFQDQRMLIWLTWTYRSTIKYAKMKTKTPRKSTLQWNILRKLTLKNNLKTLLDIQAHENYNGRNWKQEYKTEFFSSINQ